MSMTWRAISARPYTVGVVGTLGPAMAHIRPSGGQRQCAAAVGGRGRADGAAVGDLADGAGAASGRPTASGMAGGDRTAAGGPAPE